MFFGYGVSVFQLLSVHVVKILAALLLVLLPVCYGLYKWNVNLQIRLETQEANLDRCHQALKKANEQNDEYREYMEGQTQDLIEHIENLPMPPNPNTGTSYLPGYDGSGLLGPPKKDGDRLRQTPNGEDTGSKTPGTPEGSRLYQTPTREKDRKSRKEGRLLLPCKRPRLAVVPTSSTETSHRSSSQED